MLNSDVELRYVRGGVEKERDKESEGDWTAREFKERRGKFW